MVVLFALAFEGFQSFLKHSRLELVARKMTKLTPSLTR